MIVSHIQGEISIKIRKLVIDKMLTHEQLIDLFPNNFNLIIARVMLVVITESRITKYEKMLTHEQLIDLFS
jgi:hypothetical protein